MLVLKRSPRQRIVILVGDERIYVSAPKSKTAVQIGVDAPSHVRIMREEVYEREEGEGKGPAA